MGVHEGHRDRIKSSFLEHGLDSFNELNSLELLLFYAIPRRDTNAIAHSLLERFGDLNGVFNASLTELKEVDGVGESAAILLKLVPEIIKKSRVTQSSKLRYIRNTSEAAEYLIPRFLYEPDEIVLLVCLDSKKKVISCSEVGRGVVNMVELNVRKIAEQALKSRADCVILAHNHPDSPPKPSNEDDEATKLIGSALQMINVPLIDHIIVSDEDYISYADLGLIK